MAWASRFRRIESAVLLGPCGQDITRWVRGPITIERSTASTVATGSIPLKHASLPWFAPGSWSMGPQQVEIWVREVAEEWVRIFRGVAEMPANSGLWKPAGSLRIVSHSHVWANTPLCLTVAPFAEQTRKQLLELAIGIAGLPVAVTGSWPGGRPITRPVDISGQSLVQLLQRWGEIEGGSFREVDGGLELIDLATCWGPSASALWDFTRYTSPAETPPSRPVTSWVFSGTEPKLPDEGTTTTVLPDNAGSPGGDPGGDPVGVRTELTRTVTGGVITEEIEERYQLYAPKGVTPGTEELRLVRRVTTTFTFAKNENDRPTGRLTEKVTVTEEWKGILAATGESPNFTWSTGEFSTEESESFREVKRITEIYGWNAQTCTLGTKTIETREWFAALSEPSFNDPEVTWTADSSLRISDVEEYQVRTREKTSEGTWTPGDPWSSTMASSFGMGSSRGRVRWLFEGSERCAASYSNANRRRNFQRATAWIESADGLSHQKWTRTWPAEAAWEVPLDLGIEAGRVGIVPQESREDSPEPIPLPPMESGTSMVYALRPWVTSFVVSTRLPEVVQSEELLDAETVEEAERVGRDRARRAFAVRETLDLPADPRWQLWDPIRFSSPARNCDLRPGWIESLRLSLEPFSGRFSAQIGLALDPFPSVAP